MSAPSRRPPHAPPLDGYRLIGTEGTAALIDGDAVIDWWCHPHLDSPPQLWTLLDEHGGTARWWNATGSRSVGLPAGPSARTAVNIDGEVLSCWDSLLRIDGEPAIVRLIRSTTRVLGVTHELRAGGFDGSPATITVHSTGASPPHTVGASTFTSLEVAPDRWEAVVLARPGSLAHPLDVVRLRAAVHAAEARAEELADAAIVVTAHRDRVATGLLVLDACTDPGTGAVVAAPTTSVPEARGADRQFDYRYAWIRDASIAAAVAALVGRTDVVRSHLHWITDRCLSCEGIPTPVTRASGDPVPDEVEVDDVAGWGGSTPVRTGNAAKDQVQIDGAGAIAEAVWTLVTTGSGLARAAYRGVAVVADHVADLGPVPTGGMWELREPVDVASADIGRWLLLDRARRLSRVHQPLATRRRRRWREAEEAARGRVLSNLLPTGATPLVYGRPHADAAGLLLVIYRLLDRDDPVAHRVVDGTIQELGRGHPLTSILRYPNEVDDGFEGAVGAFVPACWWAVSALAQLGRVADAHDLADELCKALPALQPEILDGEALGNLPLVWSHAEATRALYLLRAAGIRARWGSAGLALWRAGRVVGGLVQRRGRTERSQKPRNPA
jgi:hypothetical protein